MELYEYCIILKKEQRVLWTTLGIIVVSAILWQRMQPIRFDATSLINVTRSGSQQTSDYTYDGFYRLQADERFADTVVRWIGSPRGAEDILHDAGVDTRTMNTTDLERFFMVGRLSSQVIRVEYRAESEASAEKISHAMRGVLNRYSETLNQNVKDPSWFTLESGDPVIRDGRIPLWKVLIVSGAVGLFLGLWFSMFAWYWEKQKEKR
jgi:uncharacterized protein involved in exopolysaccharide biosynthesis